MKGPIATSTILHIIVLILGLVSLSSAKKFEAGSAESFPVDIVPIEELTQIQEGVKTAPKAEKSAPVPTKKPQTVADAKNTGDNEADLPTPPKPAEKPKPVETADVPAPQPKPVKKPEEVKPEEPQTDPVADAIAKEAEAAKAAEAKAAKAAEAKAAKVAEAKAAEAAEAKAAEEKAAAKAEAAAKADAAAEAAAKLEAEALLKAEADTKAADQEKKAAEKAAKEKAEKEAAKQAAAEEAQAAKEAEAATKAEAKAQAETEAKAQAAAEAKAEAAAEAKTAKAAEAKAKKAADAKKAAAQQAAEDEKLNDEIAKALINKDKASGGGAKRSASKEALGGKKATGGSKLSVSEMDALRGMIEKCWSPPTGINDAGALKITIKMSLNEAGEVDGQPKVVAGGGASGIERAAAEAARRAVLKCAPYNLPAEKYDAWSEVIVNFDPSEMF